ncbi:hypothetical protein LTR37_017830 [Vermiconidia calcicola]|uniref:Uncharacterized protein n=1 Tax=Vermiconidia calcicola TaxID=1690605 RepID=A0ACC3MKD2_9PEZI|nr:hypothetical protein LTR37_017830 [Vermiconidia calcicola]
MDPWSTSTPRPSPWSTSPPKRTPYHGSIASASDSSTIDNTHSLEFLRTQILANARVLFAGRLSYDYLRYIDAKQTPVQSLDIIILPEEPAFKVSYRMHKALITYQGAVEEPTVEVAAAGQPAKDMRGALEALLHVVTIGLSKLEGHVWLPLEGECTIAMDRGDLSALFLKEHLKSDGSPE